MNSSFKRLGERVSRMRITQLLKLSFITGVASIACLLAPIALAQTIPLPYDLETAKQLGKAAETSQAAAYVLGFVCVLCLGVAGWSIQKRDETIKVISELSASIRQHNDISTARNEALTDVWAKKPCALDAETLRDLIRGKYLRDMEDTRRPQA